MAEKRKRSSIKQKDDSISILKKKVLDTLDNQSAINFQMNFWFDEMMKHHQVNYSIYRVLRFLRRYPEGIEPSVIADRLSFLRQTVTNMVDDLQKSNIVKRTPHPKDRRKIYVVLTDDGLKLADMLIQEITELQNMVFDKFSREEMEIYLDIRTRIIKYTENEIKERYFSDNI